jgi:hypothetical protein
LTAVLREQQERRTDQSFIPPWAARLIRAQHTITQHAKAITRNNPDPNAARRRRAIAADPVRVLRHGQALGDVPVGAWPRMSNRLEELRREAGQSPLRDSAHFVPWGRSGDDGRAGGARGTTFVRGGGVAADFVGNRRAQSKRARCSASLEAPDLKLDGVAVIELHLSAASAAGSKILAASSPLDLPGRNV